MDKVCGKILRKSAKSYAWGDNVSFMVNGNWYSALVKKGEQNETTTLLRELAEGDEVELSIVEAENKKDPAKPYLNIVGVVKVSRLDYGEKVQAPDNMTRPVQPAGHEGDTKIRSMALAYAKDWGIALLDVPGRGEGVTTDDFIVWAKRLEQYILTGN
jgi:hypothetical protein